MKFFDWIRRFFRKKETIATTIASPVVNKEETPSVQMSSTPGIKCPECGNGIVVSIQQLTSYHNISCGFCGLELEIDKEKSEPSIAALSKLETTLADAARQRREALR